MGSVYVIVGVPAVVPVTTPVALPTLTAPELHTPPVEPLRVMLPPGQMLLPIAIGTGSGFTVTGIVLAQPVPARV